MNEISGLTETDPKIHKETIFSILKNHTNYIIFFTPRSGSTWLTELAKNTGKMGTPHELLSGHFLNGEGADLGIPTRKMMGADDLDDYLLKVAEVSSSSNRVFGIELSKYDAEFAESTIEKAEYDTSKVPMFYLRRKNIVAQGISLYRSVVSSAWHSHSMDCAARDRYESVGYDAEQIRFWINHILNEYEAWFAEKFIQYGVKPIELYYEELEENPQQIIESMLKKLMSVLTELL
ncbi:Stf0 family sulfotransferase [Methylorubrum aminovorans]